jgi:hypothetical protein
VSSARRFGHCLRPLTNRRGDPANRPLELIRQPHLAGQAMPDHHQPGARVAAVANLGDRPRQRFIAEAELIAIRQAVRRFEAQAQRFPIAVEDVEADPLQSLTQAVPRTGGREFQM